MRIAGPLGEWGGNVDKMGIRVLASATSGKFGIDIIENNGTGDVTSSDITLDEDQDYYVIFEKIGQNCTLSIYSDPGHETLLDSVSLVKRNAVNFHYMYAPVSIDSNSDPGDLSSGYIEYLTLDPEFARSLAAGFEVRQEFGRDLTARFEVGQGSEDLLVRAEVGQGWENLLGKTEIRGSSSNELFAKFEAQATTELLAIMDIRQQSAVDLLAFFCIPKVYDLSASEGIGFYWWGSGGVDQYVDFEMWSPTGGWVGKFYDGPARFRLVQIEWDDLTEVTPYGTRPDRSRIDGIFWNYHTHGVRRVDGIHAWLKQDLLAKFTVRQAASVELLGKLSVNHP